MTLDAARTLLQNANRIQLVTHISPDGDAIGSLLGLSWALRAAGKTTVPFCEDGCPDTFKFLPGTADIVRRLDETADVTVFLDCAEKHRAGKLVDKLPRQPDLNIDHHTTNPNYAKINIVDASAAATAEVLTDLLPGLGLPLGKEAADCLLCGVVSDTLGFRTSNTNAKALGAAQSLMAVGADLPGIYDQALNRRSFQAVLLWGQALSRATLEDRIAWTTIPLAVKQAVGYNGKGDADVINVLSTVGDADVFITIIETSDTDVKISWRARPGLDVSKIAQTFGGGGHISAAGANIKGTLAEIERKVLDETRKVVLGEHQ
jgi:bifunctional oligoribonuclease and PAP phosphatase NrnA